METKWALDLAGQPFIEMIKIPAGTFTMGSNESSYTSEKPEQEVFLRDYYISKYPITNRQFYHFIQETGYTNADENFLQHWETGPDGDKFPPKELLDHPVVYVNWVDCLTFCRTYGLTLPSEAQWEKAARGTDKRMYPWGNDEPDPANPQCNFRNIFDGTTPVGTFDGSRETYNGIPIQKGTSPYGAEDMAGNVWEWCLDEWDSKWLENMGENPVDPCNYKTANKRGLSLEQILKLSSQLEERKEQLPFQREEYCGAVRGTTTLPPTSAPPLASTSTRRSGSTTTASESASDQQEESNPLPFSQIESCGAVRGTMALPSPSAPRFATTSTRRSGTTATASESASKQEEKVGQAPFQEESCGEVRGTTLSPSSAPLLASTLHSRTDITSSDSNAISEQEESKPLPFSQIESCGGVHGATTIPPSSAPPIAAATTRRTGTTTSALDVASEEEQEEEKLPFSEHCMEDPGTSLDIGKSKTLYLSLETGKNHQQKEMMGLDSEVASEEEEGESPFQNTESCGAVHGTTTILPTSVPQIVATTTRHTNSTEIASESASEEAEDQIPFSDTECCGAVRGTTTIPPSSAPPIATTTTRRSGATTTACVVASEEGEDDPPFQIGDCGEAHGTIADIHISAPPITIQAATTPSDSGVDSEQEAEEKSPFQDIGEFAEVRGIITVPPTSAHLNLHATIRQEETTSAASDVTSKQQNPFQDAECCGAVRGSTTLPPSSAPPFATTTTRRTGTSTSALESASKKEEEVDKRGPFSNTESREEVQGTSTLPPTSAPPLATASTRRSGSTASACVVASEKQEQEHQNPFQHLKRCEDAPGACSSLEEALLNVLQTEGLEELVTEIHLQDSDVVSEQQEQEHQNPFQEISSGAEHGSSMTPQSSNHLNDSVINHYSEIITRASALASKQEEEEESPFQDIETCEEARGFSIMPPISTPLSISTVAYSNATSIKASEVASEQQEEAELPFQKNDHCEEVRGTSSILPTSAPQIVTAIGHQMMAGKSDSDAASKQEGAEQDPFSDTECCGAVRGTSAIPPTSAPPIATSTTRRSGTSASACVVASDQQEAKEDQFPFRDTESCGEVRGSAAVPTAFAPPIATTSSRRTGSIFSALDAPPEQEAEEVLPFHNTECCGAVRGSASIPPTSAPPIATSTTRHTGSAITACVVASEEGEVKQNPFQDTEYCAVPPSSAPPIATTSTRQTGTSTSASDVAFDQQEAEELLPFSVANFYEEDRGIMNIQSMLVPAPDAVPELNTEMTLLDSSAVLEQEAEDKLPFFKRSVPGSGWDMATSTFFQRGYATQVDRLQRIGFRSMWP